jgi:uncharacterized membrane protein YbaN (DUF454 family)
MPDLNRPLDIPAQPPMAVRGVRRLVYVMLGWLFVGLAAAGAVLPLLPTTPFVLLASYFFVRSSPRLNAWLLRSRWFGRLLNDWQQHRGLRPHVKVNAVLVICTVVPLGAYLGSVTGWTLAALVFLTLVGLTVVVRLPTVRDEPAEAAAARRARETAAGRPGQ